MIDPIARVGIGYLDARVQPDPQPPVEVLPLRIVQSFKPGVDGGQPFVGHQAVAVAHLPEAAAGIAQPRVHILQAVDLPVLLLPHPPLDVREVVAVGGART